MSIRDAGKLVISLGLPLLAGFLGSIATVSSISTWYAPLIKPELNPPDWVFGPVWTTLYILMGIALFLVWRGERNSKDLHVALGLFFVQLVLNSLWSIIFFGLQSPGFALAELALLWPFVAATCWAFYRISKTAALLLIPYTLWISFAGYLNYSIWMLN